MVQQFNAQYDKHIGWLQDHHNLPSLLWNVYEIERLHSLTYPSQRADIVGLNALKIVSLVAKWPFLFKANWFLYHFKTLTGVDIAFIFEENLKIKSTIIVKFLQHQKEMQLAINEMILAGQGNVLAPLVAAILGICQFFKESSKFLFHQTMEHANVDDIEKDITLPLSPCISFAGTCIFKCNSFYLVVDRHVIINNLANPLLALVVLFAAYYVLNVGYPVEIAATLEFLQRCIIKINPEKGNKIEKKIGKKQYVGPHPKVISFVNELGLFEWTEQQ
ncbi:uncharacterized protein LOC124811048 [Hydra vulgaris]|uniref:uncharacterized protein LOC124811048 n=1 Tax=Hydra vulgaris TaxID=6087 RepID=UPI001F5E4A5A|nr:uncharacterized protein LOC124811048 [Hydra vulgaris]